MLEYEEIVQQVEWLLNEGEPEKATLLCRRGLRRFPRDAELWFLLGDSLLESGRLAPAEKAFKNAFEIRGAWPLALAKRAEALITLNRLRFAQELGEKAYELDRDCPHCSYVKGLLHDIAGDHDVARFFFRRAAKIDSDGYFNPVVVSSRQFHQLVKGAVAQIREAAAENPEAAAIQWQILGRVHEEIPELAGISPLAACYISVPKAAEGAADNPCPRNLKGYLFRSNIVRMCRDLQELASQIHFCLMDEIEAALGWHIDDDLD